MSEAISNATADTVIALVRKKVQMLKVAGSTPSLSNVEFPGGKKDRFSLQCATKALKRAKAKNDAVRKWPRFLRSIRLNQHAVNESVLESLHNIATETVRQEELSRNLQTLYVDLVRQQTTVSQNQQKQNRLLQDKIASLDKLLQVIETRLLDSATMPNTASRISLCNELTDARIESFYLAFEDQFRGSRELILERLRGYLPHLSSVKKEIAGASAVDIGCGRGEWLEVLKREGIPACGVDMNERMVAQCQSLGLEATRGDGIAYLQGLPPESLAIVTGFHIVEHLPFPQLFELVRQSFRVLRLGGLAIFETPNPECLRVSTYSFYNDPTHRNPIPSELLAFLAQHIGFSDVQVERLYPHHEDGVLKGYLDYACLFRK